MPTETTGVLPPERDPYLRRLADAIYGRLGIDYRDNLQSLAVKTGARVNALGGTFFRYLAHLDRHPEEWDALIEAVTINETYFFREESQLEELVRTVLPKFAGREEIRVWSAACSTGEEPYSVAMAVAESGCVPLSKVRILATDINRKVLEIAERGFYPEHSMCFRRTPDHLKTKYFEKVPGGWRIRKHIRDCVLFMPWNLMERAEGALPSMDVIFCRNVLIYFDETTIRKVIANLRDQLADGGYLFTGHAETVSGLVPGLCTVNAKETFYYRKAEGES